MTANEITVAVIRCGSYYYLFDSHCRDRSGRSAADGTAVLLRFSSAVDVHRHIKRVHGVFTSSTCTCNFVVDHDRRCHWHQSKLGHISGARCVSTNVTWFCQCESHISLAVLEACRENNISFVSE